MSVDLTWFYFSFIMTMGAFNYGYNLRKSEKTKRAGTDMLLISTGIAVFDILFLVTLVVNS